jgi:hypothetical protein
MQHRFHRKVAGPLAVAFLHALCMPVAVFAQSDEFTFDEEEVEDFGEPIEFGEEEVQDWGAEDDWSSDPVETAPTTPVVVDDGVVTITGYIVPGDALSVEDASVLTTSVMQQLEAFGMYEVVGADPLQTEFAMMGGDFAITCSFDPVCIGRYARPLGIDKIVVGRVEQNDIGDWAVTIDVMDAASSSIENYRLFTVSPGTAAVQAALEPQMRTLLGIRRVVEEDIDERRGPSPVQLGMAWTTLGLGLASLGVGIAFGAKASGLQEDLESCELVVTADDGPSVCAQSQVEAQATIDDGKSAATLANVFVGTGLLLAVGSILLFTVTPGSDIDEDADLANAPRRIRNVRLAPSVDRRAVGLVGGFEF